MRARAFFVNFKKCEFFCRIKKIVIFALSSAELIELLKLFKKLKNLNIMANQLSITVYRSLQKTTPSCSVVKLSLKQCYEFENVFDLFAWLDQFRFDQKNGILQIKTVRVNSTCLIWSTVTNLPLGLSYMEYMEWQNCLLREYLNED